MKDKTVLALAGMVCITLLEIFNMICYGVDGTVLTAIVAVIAGLAGYKIALKKG